MCGIFGVLTRNNNMVNTTTIYDTILNSLIELQNRGYDSSGIGIRPLKGEHIIKKFASNEKMTSIDILKENSYLVPKDESIHVGFGHNRWATHGEKNDINSHPHISSDGVVGVVHNGIIENYIELKNFLEKNGFTFNSETDTEVIANLIAYYYNINKEPILAIRNAIDKLQGTYGLIIIVNGSSMYGVSNGSPLLLGHIGEYSMFSSESAGFCNNVKEYKILSKNDICEVIIKDGSICVNTNEIYVTKKIPDIFESISTPNLYPHWTLKEIYDQPRCILNAINNGGRIYDSLNVKLGGLDGLRDKLVDCQHIAFLGCGSSYFNACIAAKWCKQICNFKSVFAIDGCEFQTNDVPKSGKICFVLISQSGETIELYKCLQAIKKEIQDRYVTVGIINVVDSLISREVCCGIYCNGGRERGVASTKSFTSQNICLIMSILWFAQEQEQQVSAILDCRINMIKDIHELSTHCSMLFTNHIENQIQKLQSKFKAIERIFILGKGIDYFVANEVALKLKEIAYVHAEGYSSSSLKHGPFALLDSSFPVLLIDTQPEYYTKNDIAIQEINSRGSPIFVITNRRMDLVDNPNIITVPYSCYSYLFALMYLQIFAYRLSIQRNINPDIPRNLAKVVTVE